MHRYDLTDAEWRLIVPFFPDRYHPRRRGPPLERPPPPRQRHPLAPPHRRPLARYPRALRPLADRLRPLQPLAQDGTWARILDALLLRVDKAGLIDRDLWCVDASIIRASRAAAGAKKKSGPPATAGGLAADANAGAT